MSGPDVPPKRNNHDRDPVEQPRHASRAAPAGHRRVPPHDRPPVRGPREVRPRARGGDADRQADSARLPDRRRRGRSRRGRHLPRGRDRQRPPASEAARRHREGSGGGAGPRPHSRLQDHRALFRGRGRAPDRRAWRSRRRRGADAIPLRRVREVRQAQQDRAGRGARLHRRGRGPGAPRGHHRRPSLHQALRQAGAAGDAVHRAAAGADLRADPGRDLGSQGREEDQVPGQDPDGEDPARVLPQRADEGDPARARRGRGRSRRDRRVRGPDRGDQALEGGP